MEVTYTRAKNDTNFVNESHLSTQGKTVAKAYTITAREPSICNKNSKHLKTTLGVRYAKGKLTWLTIRIRDLLDNKLQLNPLTRNNL